MSPVTMRTVIPARWHFLMASGTWWEHGGAVSRRHAAGGSGVWQTHLGPNRVLDADDSDAGEAAENVALIIPVRLSFRGWEVSVGQADGPEPL